MFQSVVLVAVVVSLVTLLLWTLRCVKVSYILTASQLHSLAFGSSGSQRTNVGYAYQKPTQTHTHIPYTPHIYIHTQEAIELQCVLAKFTLWRLSQ